MEDLESLLQHAEERESIISGVTEHLQSELSVLSEFLDNVASRRPKGMEVVMFIVYFKMNRLSVSSVGQC